MATYTEQDPLLPRAPEIQGSQPQSFNDFLAEEQQLNDEKERERRPIKDLVVPALLIVLTLLIFCRSLALNGVFDEILGSIRPEPRTIEERVSRILTDTPLIGLGALPIT